MKPPAIATGYDRLARPYAALEYLTFGQALERARFCYLERILRCRRILIVGEGDGRFLSRLLSLLERSRNTITGEQVPRIDVIDSSSAMLERTAWRCRPLLECSPPDRPVAEVEFHHCTLDDFAARTSPGSYDGIVSHFFLDQFENQALDGAIDCLSRLADQHCVWLVSDYWNGQPSREPSSKKPSGNQRGGLASCYSSLCLALLYPFFRLITGIQAGRLEDPQARILSHRFVPGGRCLFLGGVLIAHHFERPDCAAQKAEIQAS